MVGKEERWFGPGETARRLGVTTKALRVYEREGLVIPHRAESGWRLYGPMQLVRLHQIAVLRDLGMPLKSIKGLLESQSRLREVLRLQRESLESRQVKISHAIALIKTAECRLDEGQDLSLDDLATLTKETVVQHPISIQDFQNRFVARVSERDPTGEASRAIEQVREETQSANFDKTFVRSEVKAILAEASRLKDTGDINAEPAKQLVRRMRSLDGKATLPLKAHEDVIRDAFNATLADAQAKSEALPFDSAALDFLRQVSKGMKERGELT
ncbi:MerR family transcriptional regulator [Labrys neptuniae]